MKGNAFRVIGATILFFGLLSLGMLQPLKMTALNLEYYKMQWDAFGIGEAIGMPGQDLARAGGVLIDYFTGKASTPQTVVKIHGSDRSLYNETELLHLEDVQILFRWGLKVLKGSWVLVATAGLFLLGMYGEQGRRVVSRTLIASGLAGLTLLLLLGLAARSDFTEFWTGFHLVVFANDLWRLDPLEDRLIMMFPEEFFESSVFRAGAISLAISGTYLVLGFMVNRFAAYNGS